MAFPAPTPGPIPAGTGFPAPRVAGPGPARQGERLGPQFAALQDAFAEGRVQRDDDAPATDPELLVVFEIAGSVQRFARAITGIDGLELLAELAGEAAEPDDEFHQVDPEGNRLDDDVSQFLYLAMSNSQAVGELVRLFQRWQTHPDEQFAYGLNAWRDAFSQLRGIRRWSAEDRVRETGLLEDWRETVAVVGGAASSVRVEIDLGFRAEPARRDASQARVQELIEHAGGVTITQASIEAIRYHGLLADLPHRAVEDVLADGLEAIQLLTADDVMLVAPVRPMGLPAIELPDAAEPAPASPIRAGERPVDAPRVAVLDGMPLSNHQLLAGRLSIDDPDDRADAYSSPGQRQHGTAVASLICHGDLADPDAGPGLSSRLYLRPILRPHPARPGEETVVVDELLVDLIHRSFVRLFDGEGDEPPAAPSVRVVNLSVGDPARVFVREMSPLARLLDWLSYRYNVLIVVSAGNHTPPIHLAPSVLDDPAQTEQQVLTTLATLARRRRILAPAEAANALTVGAQHLDAITEPLPGTVVDVLGDGLPAIYSAVGFGHRRAVKPEVLAPGGRLVLQRPPPTAPGGLPVELPHAPSVGRGPGLQVAAPDPRAGSAGSGFVHGTSFAAALTSRAADQVLQTLTSTQYRSPTDQPGAAQTTGPFPLPDPQYHPVLAKTLLVHSAGWGELASALRHAGPDPTTALTRLGLTQLLGYGAAHLSQVAAAASTRVVLLGAGTITNAQRHSYEFPLPPAMRASTDWRRLTVTLAWFSPIGPNPARHRAARVWFAPPADALGVRRTEAHHHRVRQGTVQHEILEGTEAVAFLDGDVLSIDVDCRVDITGTPPVRYGLAASIEVAATSHSDIHSQVRQGLIRIQQRQQIRT